MSIAAGLQIDPTTLTRIARRALRRPSAQLRGWTEKSLSSELGGAAGVHLISGVALDAGQPAAWSAVLKIASPPPTRNGVLEAESGWKISDHNYWKREALLYRSGLLDELVGPLSAPQCFEVIERPDGSIWIWLERLGESGDGAWPLERYGLAGRHFGQFNGRSSSDPLRRIEPWLSHHWIEGWQKRWSFMLPLIGSAKVWDHPRVRRAFPSSLQPRALDHWAKRDRLLAAIERSPQTFCHRDAHRRNLFARDGAGGPSQTVAVDWAFAGSGAIGEEISQLVVSSLLRGSVNAADATRLDEAAFGGYSDGLDDAGCCFNSQAVRLGYVASAALRWAVPGLFGLIVALDEDKHADAELRFGMPIDDLLNHWGKVAGFILDLADEASHLIPWT